MTEHMRSTDPCVHDATLVNRHEASLATLTQTMNDFIARSTEDRRACERRYADDRQESREFRQDVKDQLKTLNDFMFGLKPDNKMLMTLAYAIVAASLALIWKMLWTKIPWHP